MKYVYLLVICFLFESCKSLPLAGSVPVTEVKSDFQNFKDDQVVYVDTRSALEYESFHIPGTVHLWWEDFLYSGSIKSNQKFFEPELKNLVRRLALKGVQPDKQLILIHNKNDSSELLRWVWLFKKIKIENVQIKTLEHLKQNSKGQNRRFQEPLAQETWNDLKGWNQAEYQDKVLKLATKCFVSFQADSCKL